MLLTSYLLLISVILRADTMEDIYLYVILILFIFHSLIVFPDSKHVGMSTPASFTECSLTCLSALI